MTERRRCFLQGEHALLCAVARLRPPLHPSRLFPFPWQGGLVGVFGRHTWDLEARSTWQDPEAAAVPPPLPAEDDAGQLTPREIIANTPRRSTLLGRSAAGGSSGAQTARRDAAGATTGGSLAHSALPSVRCLHSEATERPSEVLARLAQMRMQEGRAGGGGGAAALPGSPRRQTGVDSPRRVPAAAPSLVLPPGEASAAPSAGEALSQLLSPESAGARLAGLASTAAASKADRWSIPVHVQAHSALALQRMDEVPADAGGRVHDSCGGRVYNSGAVCVARTGRRTARAHHLDLQAFRPRPAPVAAKLPSLARCHQPRPSRAP